MKTVDQLLSDLSKYVYKPDNPMWQDGLLMLNNRTGNLDLKLIQFEFASIEEKQMMRPVENTYSINLNEEINAIFHQLKNIHGENKWDALILEVKHDGSFIPHYEFEGDEVFFNIEDKNSTEYILSNLHNCIAHNAAENYVYVAIEIEKNNNESTARYLEAVPERENLKIIQPGENIYTQNLAMKILDESRLGETNKWRKACIFFYSSGEVKYKVD